MADITAFGTIFAAFGCRLNYNSEKVRLEVIDSPKTEITDKAIADIDLFDDTVNYVDGAAALVLAETIDGSKNPLSETVRQNVLEGLAICRENKYIYQVLSLQKNNRAWHFSDVPNDCSHFGEVCTHRGINPDPERKGKRSNRKPDQYHRLDSHDNVTREQLVTPAVENLFQQIPKDHFISGRQSPAISINLKEFRKLKVEEQLRVINDLKEIIA